ncbi:type IV secretion system protein VirD4 [Nitrospirillum amazonense]|uniref:Type IV secretion system protein VirD4 n=1 Tax=Nitrospirillum amazonense TaxID=28077 RepID=A0A560EJ07_9PROT|nr:type IV secretory system conjugative DNA transfer family protein [Nitrospirillum amazonense]TWB09326.1 type IV secretion system protein VirD4 [Nitrospirillum amazonense]
MVDLSKFPRGVPGRDLRNNIAPFAVWADPYFISTHPHWAYEPGKVFLGALEDRLLGVSDDRHMMTIAGSRAGKGVSTIIPNLLEYPGSILAIDPKGENARLTKNRRARGSPAVAEGLGQDVYVLDPFGVSGHPSSGFNPLSMIDVEAETAVDDAALIAEALVIQEEGPGRHFSAAARNFLRGLILQVCSDEPPATRNLPRVRQLLTLDDKSFKVLLEVMQTNSGCHGVIRRAANSLAAKSENERTGVISTAIEQTDFLDSPPLGRCLAHSDFSLTDLKRKPTTVYLCLPAGRMATHSRWLRIIINLAVEAMEREPAKPQHPVLFLMDEFAVLDHLSSIEKAAGQIAGFGVRLWPILQDLSQLKSIYKDRWETFMGNAGLLQFFGNNDLTTLQYLAQRLGKSTILQVSQGEISTSQSAGGFTGESTQLHTAELMTADEVARFFSRQSNAQLLLWPGADPIAIDRVRYYSSSFFAGKFDSV